MQANSPNSSRAARSYISLPQLGHVKLQGTLTSVNFDVCTENSTRLNKGNTFAPSYLFEVLDSTDSGNQCTTGVSFRCDYQGGPD